MLQHLLRSKVYLVLSFLIVLSVMASKSVFAQTSDGELLEIMKSVVETENEVRQNGDVDAALNKKSLDDSEKIALRGELQEIKKRKDFLKSRRKNKETLKNFKTDLSSIVSKQQKGNKILVEINSKDEATIDDPELQAQNLGQYSENKILRFEFNVVNGKVKIASKKWINSPQSYSINNSDFPRGNPVTPPADTDEYLNNLSASRGYQNITIGLSHVFPLVSLSNDSKLSQKIFKTIPSDLRIIPQLTAQSIVLNRSSMKSYVIKWVYSRNSAYRSYTYDCTNFASQVLEAGGWRRVGDQSKNPKDTQWWYTTSPSNLIPPNQSESWTIAPMLYDFINRSGRATPVNSISQLNTGDIIFVDFGYGEGITHTMIVTAKSSTGEILVSYHSNDTYLKPMSSFIAENTKSKFFTWKLKDSY
jgi:hypothetical protein